jgi:hypothetical protein
VRREIAKVNLHVIASASEAIHTCFPFCCAMDCFAWLAMTLREQTKWQKLRKRRE